MTIAELGRLFWVWYSSRTRIWKLRLVWTWNTSRLGRFIRTRWGIYLQYVFAGKARHIRVAKVD